MTIRKPLVAIGGKVIQLPAADLIDVSTINFNNVGQRLSADFNNATIANRFMFQGAVTNGNTAVGAIPNGTSQISIFNVFNNSTPTNSAVGSFQATGTDISVRSDKVGTGTYMPLSLYTNGSSQLTLDIAGGLTFNAIGSRLYGDFSNGTQASRMFLQTSTANSSSIVGVLPSGTGTVAAINVYNTSTPGASVVGQLAVTATGVNLVSTTTSGTYLPLTFQISAAEAGRFDLAGNLGVGVTDMSASGANAKLAVNGIINLPDTSSVSWGGGTGRCSVTASKAAGTLDIVTASGATGGILTLNAFDATASILLKTANTTQVTIASTGIATFTQTPVAPTVATNINNTQLATTAFVHNQAITIQTGFRNKIMNGDFSIWQRSTTQTASGVLSADRWNFAISGSTQSVTRGTWTLGAALSNSQWFAQNVVTSVAGASNFAQITQSIEDVTMLAGQTVTLSFVANTTTAAKNIAIELVQNFGTGGSPSANVTSIGSQLVNISTTPTRYSVTIAIPSISGKTLGTTSNTSATQLVFWLDAGSSFNARTATLGQQSGTWVLNDVQLEIGSIATAVERIPMADQRARCQRYYEIYGPGLPGYAASSTIGRSGINFVATKHLVAPTISLATGTASINNTGGNPVITSITVNLLSQRGAQIDFNVASGLTAGQGVLMNFGGTPGTDALVIDAEF